jgi:hypothetical protein
MRECEKRRPRQYVMRLRDCTYRRPLPPPKRRDEIFFWAYVVAACGIWAFAIYLAVAYIIL